MPDDVIVPRTDTPTTDRPAGRTRPDAIRTGHPDDQVIDLRDPADRQDRDDRQDPDDHSGAGDPDTDRARPATSPADPWTGSRAPSRASAAERTGDRRARAAAWTFGGLVALAAVAVLAVLGRGRWFYYDEWEVLATRHATSAADLFRPHNEHWITLEVLVYRALAATVGLRTYLPYQAVVVALHLTVAVLVRVVMRRAGVGPWTATLTAGLLLLLGGGDQNIVWAFQMGIVASLAFGLGHLLLADHDGPADRRDVLGLLCGLAALMTSGVAITMVIVVGLAVLVRRGRRAAALHVLPLAAVYAVWWVAERPSGPVVPAGSGPAAMAQLWTEWVTTAITNPFTVLGSGPVLGTVLGILLVSGAVIAWWPLDRATIRRRAAAPVALVLGAIVFAASSGTGRWFFGPESARASRYAYVGVVLVLPALAVAADAWIRRSRVAGAVVGVLLLVGVPGNIRAFDHTGQLDGPDSFAAQRAATLALAHSPLLDQVPDWVEPDRTQFPGLNAGWLRREADAGRIPAPDLADPAVTSTLPIRLGIAQTTEPPPRRDCRTISAPVDLTPARGDTFGVDPDRPPSADLAAGTFTVTLLDRGRPASYPVWYSPAFGGHTFHVVLADLQLRVTPVRAPSTICR